MVLLNDINWFAAATVALGLLFIVLNLIQFFQNKRLIDRASGRMERIQRKIDALDENIQRSITEINKKK
ncbi:hypothetical protein A2625_07690 [candidate division WOR-1 bacterium RIFCSPHIGHO2_01_FULL_53_15]|uniref:Uncharacterized protein n=1 Tax=candidate division WOR-1 bacterium RIFCSPHIGHO2_01_FULL_53_15 TaxID=1802564 RepID=A0A1F4Q4M1_UNCSA|nr:MAG: hypothetical protein A2625_07690 [candidate division WOR-1 bacterium RIFCSPHIGHO2_01_FULL_53_15]OGC10544.1 MAG: hypothetical protein A3D23_01475 [candidate division WOR-1 bacterium RIFCSPHIGHO2_02_FULL_53_26]